MKHRVREFFGSLFVIVVMSLLILIPKTDVKAAYNPTGCVDFIRTGMNSVSVGGWAFDRDQMSKSIEIHVYVEDSDSGREYGVNIGSANGNRPDVNNVYGCGNNHGFTRTFNVPSSYSGKRQKVYVYAINIYGGNNVLIGQQSVYIPSESKPTEGNDPTGSLDLVSAGMYQVSVGGWAFDKDKYSHSIEIHVYVGEGNSEYGINIGQARGYRPDVGKVYGCGNYHGFTTTFNVPENLCGKRQEVYVYAINVFGGNNVCIGHKSVYIPSKSRPKEDGLTEKRLNAIKIAKKEVNSGYQSKYCGQGSPWCVDFACWVIEQAGAVRPLMYGKYIRSTNLLAQYYKEQGRWHNKVNYKFSAYGYNIGTGIPDYNYVPIPGDIVAIENDGGRGTEPDHTGFVVAVNSSIITTIEGNVSNKVAYRYYKRNSLNNCNSNGAYENKGVYKGIYIVGFSSPEY